MTRTLAILASLGVVALALVALPATAQTKTSTVRSTGPFSYDASKEITLNGTVTSLLAKPEPGMIMGAHLAFATSSGRVDASLGRWALVGKGALSADAGKTVAVTGVMKTIKNQQVFLARTVKIDGQIFEVRTERGTSIPPQSRERLALLAGQKGVQQ